MTLLADLLPADKPTRPLREPPIEPPVTGPRSGEISTPGGRYWGFVVTPGPIDEDGVYFLTHTCHRDAKGYTTRAEHAFTSEYDAVAFGHAYIDDVWGQGWDRPRYGTAALRLDPDDDERWHYRQHQISEMLREEVGRAYTAAGFPGAHLPKKPRAFEHATHEELQALITEAFEIVSHANLSYTYCRALGALLYDDEGGSEGEDFDALPLHVLLVNPGLAQTPQVLSLDGFLKCVLTPEQREALCGSLTHEIRDARAARDWDQFMSTLVDEVADGPDVDLLAAHMPRTGGGHYYGSAFTCATHGGGGVVHKWPCEAIVEMTERIAGPAPTIAPYGLEQIYDRGVASPTAWGRREMGKRFLRRNEWEDLDDDF